MRIFDFEKLQFSNVITKFFNRTKLQKLIRELKGVVALTSAVKNIVETVKIFREQNRPRLFEGVVILFVMSGCDTLFL